MAGLLRTGLVVKGFGYGISRGTNSSRLLTKLNQRGPDLSSNSRYKSGGGKSGGKSSGGGGAKTGGKSGGGGGGRSSGGAKTGGKSGGGGQNQVSGRTVTVQPGRSQNNPVRSSDVAQAQRIGKGVHGRSVLQVPKHTTVPSSVKQDATQASVQIKRK